MYWSGRTWTAYTNVLLKRYSSCSLSSVWFYFSYNNVWVLEAGLGTSVRGLGLESYSPGLELESAGPGLGLDSSPARTVVLDSDSTKAGLTRYWVDTKFKFLNWESEMWNSRPTRLHVLYKYTIWHKVSHSVNHTNRTIAETPYNLHIWLHDYLNVKQLRLKTGFAGLGLGLESGCAGLGLLRLDWDSAAVGLGLDSDSISAGLVLDSDSAKAGLVATLIRSRMANLDSHYTQTMTCQAHQSD